MKSKVWLYQVLMVMVLAQPLVAAAHPFHWARDSMDFVGGLLHPFTSLDHVLTLLVVGFGMARTSKRVLYYLPIAFVIWMLLGCALALMAMEWGWAENAMYLGMFLLSVLLITGRQIPLLITMPIMASVAVLHGYTHAYDIWLDVDAIDFTAGFAVSTLALLLFGFVGMRFLDSCVLKYAQHWAIKP